MKYIIEMEIDVEIEAENEGQALEKAEEISVIDTYELVGYRIKKA